MGVYKNQGHELEDSLINHSQKEVFLGIISSRRCKEEGYEFNRIW